jgi:hypothetical protein
MANAPDVDQIRRLAAQLAISNPGPGSALATELAEALAGLSARVDALWDVISAVVASAGLDGPAEADSARADFAAAVASARRTGHHGLQLRIDGREWFAALSQESPDEQPQDRQRPDPDQAAWPAIERLARESSARDDR